MNVLDILTYPDTFLKNKAKPVEQIDGRLQGFIDRMADTMYEAPGVGLAAVQVGSEDSLIIYDVAAAENDRALNVLINPTILEKEGEIISENEGCLSVPDFRADVKRAGRIFVEGLDRDGNPLRFEAEGILAIVLQHEIDHLSGTLFIDHVSALKRQMYARRVKKLRKQQGA